MNPTRSKTKKEKELADNARLLRAWKEFHREEREAVLAGPYGTTLTELFRMFANMQHVRPSQLVGYTRAIEWSEIDYPTRLTFGSDGGAPALPTPSTPPLTSRTPTPGASSPPAAAAPDNPLGMQHVAPLTAKEVTGDEIMF